MKRESKIVDFGMLTSGDASDDEDDIIARKKKQAASFVKFNKQAVTLQS